MAKNGREKQARTDIGQEDKVLDRGPAPRAPIDSAHQSMNQHISTRVLTRPIAGCSLAEAERSGITRLSGKAFHVMKSFNDTCLDIYFQI